MRKLGIAIIVVVVVIVAGVLIFAATFDVNKYRGTIQSELEKQTGRRVRLGEIHLGIFPPRFRVRNLSVDDDPHFNSKAPFLKATELGVSVKLLPLLDKQIDLDSLELVEPSLNLIKNPAGVWNFASLGQPPDTTNQTNARPKSKPTSEHPVTSSQTTRGTGEPASRQFSLAKLTIEDGQVSLLDQAESKIPALYDHIDVTVKDFAPDQPFTLETTAHLAGSGSRELKIKGTGGPLVKDELAKTPFHGTLDLKDVGVADLAKFLNAAPLNGSDGVMTGETRINAESGKVTAEGEANVQNAKVHGIELGYPISARYDLTDDLALELITIRKLDMKLGQTPLGMTGTVNTKPTPAQLDLDLKGNNVSIAEAAKLAAASGVAFSKGTTVSGNLNANIRARGPADKPQLNGTMTATNIQMSGPDIPQPVQIRSIDLNLTPSEVRSSPFSLTSGGTSLNAQLAVRNYATASPLVDASLRAPSAQLPAILAMAKAYGVTSLDKVNGAGILNLDMHASGPVKSITASEILKALNGTMNVNFNDVKYSGANISQELASIAGFLNPNATGQTAQGITNILKITGNILVKSGIAQTNDLQAQLDIGNIGLVGTANLATEALNMRAIAVLSRAVSQKVGGQNIGGYMKTALGNSQGELVIPALVTGTFSNPRFTPDIQQLAQMKLKSLIPTMNNPASVGGALQNLLGGPKAPAEQPQEQSQPENPVQQIIGLFGKKKPQSAPPPK